MEGRKVGEALIWRRNKSVELNFGQALILFYSKTTMELFDISLFLITDRYRKK
jgi:hypothetical protein